MIASEILREVAPSRLTTRRLVVAALLLAGLVVAWMVYAAATPLLVSSGPWLYAPVSLALIALTANRALSARFTRAALLASLISDVLFCLLLLISPASYGGAAYLVYGLVVVKAAALSQQLPTVLLIPCLLGMAYLAMPADAELARQPLFGYLGHGLVLAGTIGSAGGLLWLNQRQAQQIATLTQRLSDERTTLGARVREIEETATDLRTRVRELQSLEEGLRVISSSLSLSDVLKLITSGTSELLGTARVDHAALTLFDGDRQQHTFLASSRLMLAPNWPEPLARKIGHSGQPFLATSAARLPELTTLVQAGMGTALGVPIFDENGGVRGALTIVSRADQGFSPTDLRHLGALAAQASIAIRNAELHDKLQRQQALLEAVIRDISDGLVVIDDSGRILVANPTARALIVADSFSAEPLSERLVQMAESLRQSDGSTLEWELRLRGEDGDERVCQAFGTPIAAPEVAGYVAILLHDITPHREEMRERTEFVSMVSHELRNPLHSLNGFLKVVLQGRAGTLNETQQEFLGLAAMQVEQLKGRIGELLEFNRLEAGRLSLHPEAGDLTEVARSTVQRLQIQAEQAHIRLINEVPEELPSVFIDGERIGQVLTNLIENAIKATPAEGTIRVRARLVDDAIEVGVSDTGVGIPKLEQAKVFGRFYQLRNKGTRNAGHLGLGLTICQQIVEGHQGRIWVESEENQGSTFLFTLPLASRVAPQVAA
jgi:two-component system, NtrC family, sensor histidine kinase KinB